MLDSVYWVVISGTAIGLGDFAPEKQSTRLFCVFFLPFAVAFLGKLLARIASAYMDRKHRAAEEAFLSRSLALSDINTMDTDRDGRVDKVEFLSYMLVALQKVPKDDVKEITALFDKLDVSQNGYLDRTDLVAKDWGGSVGKSFRRASVAVT